MASDDMSKTVAMEMEGDPLPASQKVAIVGIGCRYAGDICDADDFLRVLREGIDCSCEMPSDRFDLQYFYYTKKAPGKMYNTRGGYMERDHEMFDRQFFKMPPEEANTLDPQVRLLLEVTWEGFEDAGIPPSSVKGTNSGVYMGTTAGEYAILSSCPNSVISQYTNSGTNSCMVANRISYELDLKGPSFSLDTACSSSLYSIFLACEAIKRGDCSLAVAGGVNLLLSPVAHIGFCQAEMLSPEGRCKSFDNSANGYARAEGAGVIILKPLERALEDRDNIYAVIRGGALSNDGRTPGIANPSYDAQVNLVHLACSNAKIDPHKVEYIEAHGTGTTVGDRTEANALGEVLGRNRNLETDPALYIGSVKSNFGHTEGAAGVAGVIKVALMQRYNFIAPLANFEEHSEHISFEELHLNVPVKRMEWCTPVRGHRRYSGCSSFGFGGANAHLIFENPPEYSNHVPEIIPEQRSNMTILFMSAASKAALTARQKQWREFLQKAFTRKHFRDVAGTSFHRLHHHGERMAIMCTSAEDAILNLDAVLKDENPASVVQGSANDARMLSPIVFIFTGMGSQWWAMGRHLFHKHATFQKSIKRFDQFMRRELHAPWSISHLLSQETDKSKINITDMSQPAICAVQMGLVDVLQEFKIIPSVIVGHSVGEVAAAYASKMISFEDAVRIIYYRGQELCKTSGKGKMLAVLQDSNKTIDALDSFELCDKINVAAVNSPTQVVLSGDSSAIEQFAGILKEEGTRAIMLKVNNAFHSFQQEELKESFLEKVSFLHEPEEEEDDSWIPMVSTVTGEYVNSRELNNGEYWWNNIRKQVSFKDAVKVLLKEGFSTFLEIGAHPALSPAIVETASAYVENGPKALVLGTLHRPKNTDNIPDDIQALLQTLTKLYCYGYNVDFSCMYDPNYNFIPAPHYPWQRMKCSAIRQRARDMYTFPRPTHNILGDKEIAAPSLHTGVHVWKSRLSPESVGWMADHKIDGNIVAPGTTYMEAALEATRQLNGSRLPLCLSDIQFMRFLFMPDSSADLQTVVESDGKQNSFVLFSLSGQGVWQDHMRCNLELGHHTTVSHRIDLEDLKEKCSREDAHTKDDMYSEFNTMHFSLGPSFRGLQRAWINEDASKCYSTVKVASDIAKEKDMYNFHPAMMDSLLQGMGAASVVLQRIDAENRKAKMKPKLMVPLRIKRLEFLAPIPDEFFVETFITNHVYFVECDIYASDCHGNIICQCFGTVLGRTDMEENPDIHLFTLDWKHTPLEEFTSDSNTKGSSSSNEEADVIVMCSEESMGKLLQDKVENGLKIELDIFQEDIDVRDHMSEKHKKASHIIFMIPNIVDYQSTQLVTREDFLTDVQLNCVQLVNVAKFLGESEASPKQHLWILSRGAYMVHPGDMASPIGQAAHSIAVGIMHEVLNIVPMMVDLPYETEGFLNCLPYLKTLLQSPPDTENEICIRWSSDGHTTYTRRINKWTPDAISHMTSCDSWAKSDVGKSKGIILSPIDGKISQEDDQLMVKVKAFQLIESSHNPDGFTAIVSGVVTSSCSGSVKIGRLVVGYTKDKIQASMVLNKAYCEKVPKKLCAEEAIAVTHRYMVPAFCVSLMGNKKCSVLLIGKNGPELQAYTEFFNYFGYGTEPNSHPSESGLFDAAVVLLQNGENIPSLTGIQKMVKPLGQYIIVSNGDEKAMLKETSFVTHTHFHRDIGPNEKLSAVLKSLIAHAANGFCKAVRPMNRHQRVCLADVTTDTDTGQRHSKGIITVDSRDVKVNLKIKNNSFAANPKATYVLTGASKGFGVELLKWLYLSGARSMVVMSRNPLESEEMDEVDVMQKKGLNFTWKKVDCSIPEDIFQVLKEVKKSHPPVEGIFHCATVYKDIWFQISEALDWDEVLFPKALGALALHQASLLLKLPLKYFVLFSSVTSVVGNPGQSNYCAANTFLHGLGELRRALGLPATVTSFGLINTVGFAARSGLIKSWEDMGLASVTPESALNAMGMMMTVGALHLGVSGLFDPWAYYKFSGPQLSVHLSIPEGRYSRWKVLYTQDLFNQNNQGTIQQILNATPEEAIEIIHSILAGFLVNRLGLSDAESIDAELSPMSYGLDSLIANEFSNYISQTFQVPVTPVEILNDKTTLSKIETMIYDKILAYQNKEASGKDEEGNDSNSEEEESIKPLENLRWFAWEDKLEDPSGIVVCFPPLGGGMSNYRNWQALFRPKGIQMYVVKIPGWEGRYRERPMKSLEGTLDLVAKEISSLVGNNKFTVFGHSMGALMAFEACHVLKKKHMKVPSEIFLSAWYGPKEKLTRATRLNPKIFHPSTPFEEAVELAQVLSFLDEETLQNKDMMKVMLPCMGASLPLCETYRYKHTELLPTTLRVYAGRRDRFAREELVRKWDRVQHPDYGVRFKVLEGPHMLINDPDNKLEITADIAEYLCRATSGHLYNGVVPNAISLLDAELDLVSDSSSEEDFSMP